MDLSKFIEKIVSILQDLFASREQPKLQPVPVKVQPNPRDKKKN